MSEYWEPNNYSIKTNEAQLLFKLKTKNDICKKKQFNQICTQFNCDLCENEGNARQETQKHIIICPVINRENPNKDNIRYKDLKSYSILKQMKVVRLFKTHIEIRNNLIEKLNKSKHNN